MKLDELSLLNIGFVLNGNYSPAVFNPQHFPAPYNKAMQLLQDNRDSLTDKNRADSLLTSVLRLDEIELAHEVAARQNGLGEEGAFNWAGAQADAYFRTIKAQQLKPLLKNLENNEEPDPLKVISVLTSMVAGKTTGLVSAKDIDWNTYKPYMKCGYKPIDDVIGGIPSDGPIVVIGSQGTGKSYWAFLIVCSWLLEHPDQKAAIYTLEMPADHYVWRSIKMYPEFKPLLDTGRLLISASVRGVEEIVAEASASQVGLIAIDDLDRLAGGASPEKYQTAYMKITEICRFLKVPVIVLAQPNREGKKAKKFLGIYDAAWSGAAENSAAMFLSLNNVDPTDPEWEDMRFPLTKDNPKNTPRLFMCFWKFREQKDDDKQQGVGAIRIEPGLNGYYNQIWKGEAYGNKLWTPNHQNSTVGSKPSGNAVRFSKKDDD